MDADPAPQPPKEQKAVSTPAAPEPVAATKQAEASQAPSGMPPKPHYETRRRASMASSAGPAPAAPRSVHVQRQPAQAEPASAAAAAAAPAAAEPPKHTVEPPQSAAGLTLAKMRANARGGWGGPRRQSAGTPASAAPSPAAPEAPQPQADFAPLTTRSGRTVGASPVAPPPAPQSAPEPAPAPAPAERPPRPSSGHNFVPTSHKLQRSPVAGSAVSAALAALSPLKEQPAPRSPLAAINANAAAGTAEAKVLSPGVKDAIRRFEAAATPPPPQCGGTPRSSALMEISTAGQESLLSPAARMPVPPSPGRMFASKLLRGFMTGGADNGAGSA